jgi:hypothetical protein
VARGGGDAVTCLTIEEPQVSDSALLASEHVQEYYRDPDVRLRILEYCGGGLTSAPTAAYIGALHPDGAPHLTWDRATRLPPDHLDAAVSLAPDFARSLWDTRHLLFVIDLDYLNVDAQAAAFLHPADTFVNLEPTFNVIGRLLTAFGVHAFRLITGRGYHFAGRIPLTDPVAAALARLVPEVPGWYPDVDARRVAHVDAEMTPEQARAATGLGLLTEYLSHMVLRRAADVSRIPVVVNGTVVGRGPRGRECVSFDFSHAGDPLDVRMIRVAYGTYQWHRFRPDIFGDTVASDIRPLAVIPRGARSLISILLGGRELQTGRSLARLTAARLPDVSVGIARVLARYRRSRLARFHRHFAEPDEVSPSPAGDLPPCVANAFARPNDLLLKPEHIQHVVRALMAREWSPRRIADAVAACYSRDWNWGDRWTRMHRKTRADFDVRVFAGMIITGLDQMRDYNCVSAQEKGICPGIGCSYDLRDDRVALLSRTRKT